jgi:hypothetical protein
MDFKKPNSEALKSGAALIGGATLGAMVSRGVIGALHTPTTSTVATEIASDNNKLLMYRGALILVAASGAVAISGSGIGTSLAKGALTGMAAMQTVEIVKVYASKTPSLAETTSGTKRFIAKTLGLACACSDESNYNQAAMNGIQRRRMLRGIDIPTYEIQANAFEKSIQSGANA